MSDAETIDRPSESTALATIRQALPTLLAADTDDILGQLAAKVARFVPDISTPSGRAAMKSLAAEIASTKMDLVRMGKALTEEWRTKTKAVNAECNVLEDRMDELKARVRAPLTAWEAAEKQRIEGHEAVLTEVINMGLHISPDATAESFQQALDRLPELAERDWREFQDRANRVFADTKDRLTAAHAGAVKREAEAAELAEFRRQQAEQQRVAAHRIGIQSLIDVANFAQIVGTGPDGAVTSADIGVRIDLLRKPHTRDWEEFADEAKEVRAHALASLEEYHAALLQEEAEAKRQREEAIAAAAAAQARREAETRAAAEAQVAQERATAEHRAIEERAAREAAEAARRQAETERLQAEAEQRAVAAEEARTTAEALFHLTQMEAVAQAERDRQQAVADERRRAEQEAARARAAADKRAADKAHRGKINRAAADALMVAASLTEDVAHAVIAAVARGEIPSVRIEY